MLVTRYLPARSLGLTPSEPPVPQLVPSRSSAGHRGAARRGIMAIPVQQPYAVIRTVGAAAVPPAGQPSCGVLVGWLKCGTQGGL